MVLVFPKVIYHQEKVTYDLWTRGTEAKGLIRTERALPRHNLGQLIWPRYHPSGDGDLILSHPAPGIQ